jgi:feruloyl esterase
MIPTVIPATRPPPGDTGKAVYAAGDVRYFYLRDPAHQGPVDWKKYEARIREVSVLMDATNPDLSAFKRRGGKLIMKSNSADFLVSPGSSWHYYEQVNATMGAQSARDFVRLYVAPWMSHFGNGRAGDGTATPDKVDLLAALEAWVEQGKAPADSLTLISYSGESAAATPVASWPMCSYPNYPHYRGSGDVKAATSYQCQPAK